MPPSFATKLASPPPKTSTFLVSFPDEHILLITINRPRAMNSIPTLGHWEAHTLLTWYDAEPSLRVAIITGSGPKAFCAGQDLIELQSRQAASSSSSSPKGAAKGDDGGTDPGPGAAGLSHPPTGFCGISRRMGKKPIIAAVNGFAFGGGFEICLNCDMVVASPTASFALPEAKRGLYAAAGGLPRLIRTVGLHVASEIALTGEPVSASRALAYGLVNRVSKTPEGLMEEAMALARLVVGLSPDAVVVTRQGLREAWETASVERSYQLTDERWRPQLFGGDNMKEGLEAFKEKRAPKWGPSKL